MKHLLLLLVFAALPASTIAAAAKSSIANEAAPAAMHSALVDAPKIDLSRVDPTTWPVPPLTTAPPAIKGWRYFDENRIASD
jgi:hypothetical protein